MDANDVAGASPDTMGRWSYDYADGRWSFTDELRTMWELPLDGDDALAEVLARLHDDDRDAVATAARRAVTDRVPLSGQARLATLTRGERVFAFIGEVVRGEDDQQRLQGWSVDVTTEVRAVTRDAVDGATRHRRAIEQVKGALMASYRIDEVTAFAILRKQSNAFNVKISDLAEHVSRAMTAGAARDGEVPPLMALVEAVARRRRKAATRTSSDDGHGTDGVGAVGRADGVEDSVAT